MEKNTAADAVPPPNDLTREFMVSISKEIDTTMTGITSFRTKVGFGMFVGPFLLLSSLVVAAKGQPVSFNLNKLGWAALLIDFACYLGIAFIAAKIEEQAYDQCSKWRKLLRDLCEDRLPNIDDSLLEIKPRAKEGYLYCFALLFISVLAAVVIVKNAGTVEPIKAGASAPTYRIEQVTP